MDELFLYDRDKGLFKQILKQSTVMAGRYYVSPSYGNDLNTDNLNAFLKDPKFGLIDQVPKYPCTVCMPPASVLNGRNDGFIEEFVFELFFLCTTGYTGQNKIKSIDKPSQTSSHLIWYDWKDMKEIAKEFLKVLTELIKVHQLKRFFAVDLERVPVRRVSNFNNDTLSGVSVSFLVSMVDSACVLKDYAAGYLDKIIIPATDSSIHALHKH